MQAARLVLAVFDCPFDDVVQDVDELGASFSGVSLSQRNQIRAGLDSLNVAWGRGDVCLVTCAQGKNRSALVVGLFLVRVLNMSPQDAIVLIRQARSGALRNAAFVDLILNAAIF